MAGPSSSPRLVPVDELIDVEALTATNGGREPTRRQIRAALPRGWVLSEDGQSARRDARLLFREGWILIAGMVVFGLAGAGLFWRTFPAGWAGVLRFALMIGVLLVVGGVIAPSITRALGQRRR